MKNKIITLILSIIFIVLVIIPIILLKKESTEPLPIVPTKELSGKRIADYLYQYDIDVKNEGVDENYIITDQVFFEDSVYSLLEKIDEEKNDVSKIILRKIDIYTNEITDKEYTNTEFEFFKFEIFNEKLVLKSSKYENTTTVFRIYNLNLERIQEIVLNGVIYDILPYGNSFIYDIDNTVYRYNIDTKEITTMYVNKSICNMSAGGFNINDTTYLIYLNNDTACVLNTNDMKFNYIQRQFKRYENGYYTINEGIGIYNSNNEKITYNNVLLTNEEKYTNVLLNDNNTLITYNENNVNIYNLKNETLDFKFELSNISEFVTQENLVFIFGLNSKKFHILDVSKLIKNPTKVSDISDYVKEKLVNLNKIKELENKFNVNILIEDDAVGHFPDFYATTNFNQDEIKAALKELDLILNKFTKEVFDELHHDDIQGLNIYLTGKLTPADYETQYSDPVAYSLVYNNKYMIVLDITVEDVDKYICHELMHSLENNINNTLNYNVFGSKWHNLNPKNYVYQYSYTDNARYDYTVGTKNVYFVDFYSHTFPNEDRARIFENICANEDYVELSKYPKLLEKAKFIQDVLENKYPSLKNTNLFERLNN